MTQPSPADELRAAATRLGEHTWIGALTVSPAGAGLLRGREPLVTLLDNAASMVDVWPELGDDHDREACDDYACDLIGAALDVARAINGSQP